MKYTSSFVSVAIAGLLLASTLTSTPATAAAPIERLRADAVGDVEVTYNPVTGTPSFILGQLPFAKMGVSTTDSPTAAASATLSRYASLLGINQVSSDLQMKDVSTDEFAITHVTLQQVYQGVKVFGAYVSVHLRNGDAVEAITNGYVPNLKIANVKPSIAAAQALALAQKALPSGSAQGDPQLVVYPSLTRAPEGVAVSSELAWVIELTSDSAPARNDYVVDAHTGGLVDVIELLADARSRKTYSAEGAQSLPGKLKRSEGEAAVSDKDVDNAHDFAGATYDYYFNTFQRDSFDNKGATLISTAHYGKNYKNAFWNGTQMVYGDGFPVKDVAAHELTHAVTEKSVPGGLEYKWQSGALNESISDIFGTMVDREDWLMGEDLPKSVLGGKDAIRDLSNPKRLGQPDNASGWVKTCSDNQGVHTNSGIPNKAYYNIATKIGKDKAEKIFYRALTVYFRTQSSMEDARAAALKAATDLYTQTSTEYAEVDAGFKAVGLDGKWNPPENDCTCAITTSLADSSALPNVVQAMDIAATLYRFRSDVMDASVGGERLRGVYEQYSGRASSLLLQDAALRQQAAAWLQQVAPGLGQLAAGAGSAVVVTQDDVNNTVTLLSKLAANDRANNGGGLASTIETELARVDTQKLVGMTYSQAWAYVNSTATLSNRVFLPITIR